MVSRVDRWYYLPINPEPWQVGKLGLGRKNGKVYPRMDRNEQLYSFQQAVKEFFTDEPPQLIEGEIELYFAFWRRLDKWTTPTGVISTRSVVDVTNMQKATEDALQGVLFKNDSQVKRIHSSIIEEGIDIVPGIAIWIQSHHRISVENLPKIIQEARRVHIQSHAVPTNSNVWPPPEGS